MLNWVDNFFQSFTAAVFQQSFMVCFCFPFFRHKIKVKLIVGHWHHSSLLEGKKLCSYVRAHVVHYSAAFVQLRPLAGIVPQLQSIHCPNSGDPALTFLCIFHGNVLWWEGTHWDREKWCFEPTALHLSSPIVHSPLRPAASWHMFEHSLSPGLWMVWGICLEQFIL